MPERILVTGANGFIGTALCEELSRQGYIVRAAVGNQAAMPPSASEVVLLDRAADTNTWQAALADVAIVVHLAGRAHVLRENTGDPLAKFRAANVAPTLSLAKCAAAGGVRRIVFVSSIGVNGNSTGIAPFTAFDIPRPHNAYALSKWEAERGLLSLAASGSDLQITIIRPPLVYGPTTRGNFFRLLRLVATGIPLPFARVQNRRSMIYRGNLVSALIACATSPAAANKTYLVADGEDISTPELISRIAIHMGLQPRLWGVPLQLVNAGATMVGKSKELHNLIATLQVDDSRIRAELGWSPSFTLDAGLEEAVSWYCHMRRKELR